MRVFHRARWYLRLTLAVVGAWLCLSLSARAQTTEPEDGPDAARFCRVRAALLASFNQPADVPEDEGVAEPQDDTDVEQVNRDEAPPCVPKQEMGKTLTSMTNISLDIAAKSEILPPDCYAKHHPKRLTGIPPGARRSEFYYEFYWQSFGLVHNPLHFEDVPLERYGQGYSPVLQPVVSAAKFYGNVVILPYRIGMDPPYELDYTLGYYRPGSWAPSVRPHLPWSWRGAALQAGAVTGFFFMFP